jgi:NAD(P)-dependent dehydrogenase (short-subunit alcohol dehydrogenase family)
MAMELAEKNIRVNSIAPGFFLTELSYKYLKSERGKKSIKRVPMSRIGQLEELDGVLLLLSSEMGSYITGAEIFVDGGMSVANL